MFRSKRYQSRPAAPNDTPRVAATSLLLFGLILGLAGSLTYAWLIDPVVYVDAVPARLSAEYRADYIFLVSQSYAADGDWPRAQQRLAALDDPNLAQTVAQQLELALRRGEPSATMRNLADLAARLGVQSEAIALFLPTQAAESATNPAGDLPAAPTATPTLLPTPTHTRPPTQTPAPTFTTTPTRRPTATPIPIYRLLSQERLCRPGIEIGRIEVVVQDAFLDPLPGIEVQVSWSGGSDHFFTGFQPERGAGYGDFALSPDVSYSVAIAEGSPTISGLRLESCDDGSAGGWRLTFQDTRLPTPTPTEES
jgi:hypothetical protein